MQMPTLKTSKYFAISIFGNFTHWIQSWDIRDWWFTCLSLWSWLVYNYWYPVMKEWGNRDGVCRWYLRKGFKK